MIMKVFTKGCKLPMVCSALLSSDTGNYIIAVTECIYMPDSGIDVLQNKKGTP